MFGKRTQNHVGPVVALRHGSGQVRRTRKLARFRQCAFVLPKSAARLGQGKAERKEKSQKNLEFDWSEEKLFGTIEKTFVKYIPEKRCLLFAGIFPRLVVICLCVVVMLFLYEPVDAKKKRKRFISPVKVEQVTTSPDPFIIGQGPLTLSMMVKVPASAKDSNFLEVSALFTSPTRRSMSFVSQRLPLAEVTQGGLLSLVPVELVWDGKDQYDQLVVDGSYFYEIKAKLLEDKGHGPRTKIVSHRFQGTLEALAYAGEVLPPIPPESEVPAEIEALQQEELVADDLPLIEDGVAAREDAFIPGEGLVGDGGNQGLELLGENESGQETKNGDTENLLPEIPGEALLEEADPVEPSSMEPEVPSSSVDQTLVPATEPSLSQASAEPFLSSEGDLSLH